VRRGRTSRVSRQAGQDIDIGKRNSEGATLRHMAKGPEGSDGAFVFGFVRFTRQMGSGWCDVSFFFFFFLLPCTEKGKGWTGMAASLRRAARPARLTTLHMQLSVIINSEHAAKERELGNICVL
jgi:hypothetical protein